ncbi:discoidin domain-containing protein [Paenibacillus sp. D2_2]|uniref:discoidin domain-containing protein n=1 Tax=Paenibacillus sp. D2_2 TaxID=3073092 RepID=UPI0028163FFB|nr:discoidin domain-containing protein [Paenibacillus sp. D2_2]WMT43030.1 discoidin domain-containing protein [Paenibacillus sp. D2_2]
MDIDGQRVNCPATVTLEVTDGDGLFPTGRTIELSTEAGSFLDGMGAIELRSYYAGTIQVQARCGELKSELTLEAVGAVPLAGQPLRWQSGPPSRMKAPGEDMIFNIARSRPVFCSSYAEGFLSMNVTDGTADTCWMAAADRSEEWIMVDLEGRKSADRAVIMFAESVEESIKTEIEYSFDGKTFLKIDGVKKEENFLYFDFPARELRYLKLTFPDSPAAIIAIDIYT